MIGHKGVKNLPMLMKASHIRENILSEEEAKNLGLAVNDDINYHGLGEELFKKVIDSLDDITVAYRGTARADDPLRRENCFLLLSTVKDDNGDTIIVPVYINETGNYNRVFIKTNKIASVYGKSGLTEYIRKEINKGNLVRIKKRGPISSESPAPIAVDYADVTSAEEAADQTAMASYAPNVTQNSAESQAQYELREDSVGVENASEALSEVKSVRGYIDEIGRLKGELDFAKRNSVKGIMAAYDRGRITGIIEQGIKEQKKLQSILEKQGVEKRRAVEQQLRSDAVLLNKVSRAYEAKIETEISRAERKLEVLKRSKRESLDKLRAEKNAEIEETRRKGIERLKKYKEDRPVNKWRRRVTENAATLYDWISTNSDKKHIPKVLKEPTGKLPESIDFTSQRQLGGGKATRKDMKFQSALARLNDILNRQEDGQTLDGAYLDISPENKAFIEETLSIIAQAEGGYTVNEMNAEELEQLAKLLKNTKTANAEHEEY